MVIGVLATKFRHPVNFILQYKENLFILSRDLLNDDGVFVMEHPKEYDFSGLPGFSQKRVYGAVNFSIFRKAVSFSEIIP